MSEDQVVERGEPIPTLVAVLDDPESGRRRLPELVDLVAAEDETTRIGAAWATCHVATAFPDMVTYLTRRLADGVGDQAPSLEADLVLDYLAARYPDAVAAELDAMASAARSAGIDSGGASETGPTTEPGSSEVGGVAASDGTEFDRLYRPSSSTTVADGSEKSGDGANASDESATDGPFEPADELSAIGSRSRFDQLTVLADRRRGRYADVYRTLGVSDGERLPVGLALYHRPSDREAAFSDAIDEQLSRWAAVADHDNVVPVYDWGTDPRPWAATEYAGQRLVDRERMAFSEALWNACELAGALAHVHENGVVHGGIDPRNVVYYGNRITEDERQRPLLANVGLLHVVRDYFDPTSRLDPRYAAPEYFDRRFGRIDHATDVYHLGGMLYLLFTGNPPYDGSYGRVRERVLSDPAPRPSDVTDVPAGIDDVVTKAMARRKLRRYETVTHLERELRGIAIDAGDDDS